jgi:hypothetical protein
VAISLKAHRGGDHSQHGEEGVIRAIFEQVGAPTKTCVEFGAYDLEKLSNVYSLWTHGWRAVLIEGEPRRYKKLVRDYAAHPQAGERRVTILNRYIAESGPDSLDRILATQDLRSDFDLLCIDVDGTDLHIWRGLTQFKPRVVVVEYNATIPPHIELVGSAQGNNLGSSALAVHKLGRAKDYALVACLGWNAFFVKAEYAHLFEDADDLDALFDPVWVRYAMQTYTGEVFFSGGLHRRHRPFCRDSHAIEQSSVDIFRTNNTLAHAVKEAALLYLRPAKHWVERQLGLLPFQSGH